MEPTKCKIKFKRFFNMPSYHQVDNSVFCKLILYVTEIGLSVFLLRVLASLNNKKLPLRNDGVQTSTITRKSIINTVYNGLDDFLMFMYKLIYTSFHRWLLTFCAISARHSCMHLYLCCLYFDTSLHNI